MKAVVKGLAAATVVAISALSVHAAGISVGKKLEVNVDPKKMEAEKQALWKRFGGWCSIADWHPALAKCEESKEGDATFRTLTLKDGGTIKEKLLEQVEFRYRYAIIESPLPVKNYEAQFTLTPDDDDEDEINFAWSAVFDAADGKTDKEARDVIKGIFDSGIDSIKKMTAKKGKKDDDDD